MSKNDHFRHQLTLENGNVRRQLMSKNDHFWYQLMFFFFRHQSTSFAMTSVFLYTLKVENNKRLNPLFH